MIKFTWCWHHAYILFAPLLHNFVICFTFSHDDGTTCHYDTGTQCFECIDGTTGLLAEAINEEDNGNYHPVTRIGVSRVSTYSLLEVFLKGYNLANNTNESIHTPLSLKGLICMKKKLSPDHEATKDKIFTKHRILRQWKRRSRILEWVVEYKI